MQRSVGLLRRLVLVPPRYTYIHGDERKPEWEKKAAQAIGEWARQFLKNWRGYEILYCEDLEKTIDKVGCYDAKGSMICKACLEKPAPKKVNNTHKVKK